MSKTPVDPSLRAAGLESKAWPFEEARKLLKRVEQKKTRHDYILFETGYGPSGLPHIGTFGEVARTTMMRRAFEIISDIPTRLICFSDDMDGMRKVPDNVPNQDLLKANLHKPLTVVPDPFEEFESFGHHNNAMLRRFLDTFGFEYEFASRHRLLQVGQVRRHPAALCRALRRRSWTSCCPRWARSAGQPIRASCRSRRRPAVSLCADEGRQRQGRHHHLRGWTVPMSRCRSPAAT
jgi:hypothetical protein